MGDGGGVHSQGTEWGPLGRGPGLSAKLSRARSPSWEGAVPRRAAAGSRWSFRSQDGGGVSTIDSCVKQGSHQRPRDRSAGAGAGGRWGEQTARAIPRRSGGGDCTLSGGALRPLVEELTPSHTLRRRSKVPRASTKIQHSQVYMYLCIRAC